MYPLERPPIIQRPDTIFEPRRTPVPFHNPSCHTSLYSLLHIVHPPLRREGKGERGNPSPRGVRCRRRTSSSRPSPKTRAPHARGDRHSLNTLLKSSGTFATLSVLSSTALVSGPSEANTLAKGVSGAGWSLTFWTGAVKRFERG